MKTISFILIVSLLISSNALWAQKFKVDTEKSTIKWVGKKITGQHNGFIKLKSGQLELNNNKIVSGNFVIDMNSITCTDLEDPGYNQKLVGHLKSDDFFGVAKFPTATFEVTEAETFKNGKASLSGKITIKGRTESIRFDAVKKGNEYTAKLEIDRSKFDVRYGSNSFFDNLGDSAIDDIFTLDINLVVK